jgi:hypothetical protein
MTHHLFVITGSALFYGVIPGPAKPEPGIQGWFASSPPLWIPGSALLRAAPE